jgi:hypothetical protein
MTTAGVWFAMAGGWGFCKQLIRGKGLRKSPKDINQ